jgi:hypothetical protein
MRGRGRSLLGLLVLERDLEPTKHPCCDSSAEERAQRQRGPRWHRATRLNRSPSLAWLRTAERETRNRSPVDPWTRKRDAVTSDALHVLTRLNRQAARLDRVAQLESPDAGGRRSGEPGPRCDFSPRRSGTVTWATARSGRHRRLVRSRPPEPPPTRGPRAGSSIERHRRPLRSHPHDRRSMPEAARGGSSRT